jgi:hypothetical protein
VKGNAAVPQARERVDWLYTQFQVYVFFWNAWQGGTAAPSSSQIARELGIGLSTTKRAIAHLKASGWLLTGCRSLVPTRHPIVLVKRIPESVDSRARSYERLRQIVHIWHPSGAVSIFWPLQSGVYIYPRRRRIHLHWQSHFSVHKWAVYCT